MSEIVVSRIREAEKVGSRRWTQLPLRKPAAFIVFAALTLCLLALLPGSLLSGSIVFTTVVGIGFCIGLMGCYGRAKYDQNLAFLLAIYCWWFLIISEQLFVRKGSSELNLAGSFAAAAYSEVFVWLILFITLCTIVARHGLSAHVLKGQSKWLLIFALVAIVSCAYSPAPLFALAWAFKLLVVVMILLACAEGLNKGLNPVLFWKSLYWGYLFLVFAPVASTLTHPASIFGWRGFMGDQPPEFRLNTNIHPVDLSLHAGLLVILGLTLHALDRRRVRMLVAIAAAVIMLLAVGKAAIVSCAVSTLLFFLLQKRIKAGAGWLLLLAGAAAMLLLLTPIGSYFQDYGEHERVGTLTGRTELWELAVPSIESRPILGHGFVSSKFIAEAVDLDWDAGQLHNAFLEVLYNNGCLGLLLVLAMNACIVRNLWRLLRKSDDPRARTLASGCCALYGFLLLNGFVEPTFGGRPSCTFVAFQAMLVLSDGLRRSAVPEPREVLSAGMHCSPVEA
ncbi:MAG TPA: O-antigen ligase family protein [Terriglobales bacterium]|nr:O-antigen ligase family protein [Terriglobales bacterium]